MIEFDDLRHGDIVTLRAEGFEVVGPVNVDDSSWPPYFALPNGGTLNVYRHQFVSAERVKQLPTLPGSVIKNVIEDDGSRGGLMVLDDAGNWHSSHYAIRPDHIVGWEEV